MVALHEAREHRKKYQPRWYGALTKSRKLAAGGGREDVSGADGTAGRVQL